MINPDNVFQKATELMDIPSEDEEKMTELCKGSSNAFDYRLKEGVTGDEDAVIYVAAAIAIYRYALLKSCSEENFESIKTGDISVKRSVSSVMETAEKLVTDAISYASDFLVDINFIFRSM